MPDGWKAPESPAYDLAAGARTTVTVPRSATEGDAWIAVATGTTEAESASTSMHVGFDNPPDKALDHVDLGDPASERAHSLTASAASGTSTEAGLTRRYTNATSPGGWFEFDLEVPAGHPFVLRSVETYDQAQVKDYDVRVDGVLVHSRAYHRSAGGEGSLTYQFVVDEPEVTEDGTVRVRFQDTGQDYDPSIADVGSVPVG